MMDSLALQLRDGVWGCVGRCRILQVIRICLTPFTQDGSKDASVPF